ncbi:MAG: autotransporter domain-containing protein [Parvibaculum sp.]|nr:autotransporter domain-containing protein [Parvibaculum sp.]
MGRRFRYPVVLLTFVLAAAPVRADTPATQMPAYIEFQRPILINADLWSDRPEILAANYGFEGIIGIPGLQTADDLALAVAAGAGVNLDWAALDPVPPLRNLTSGAGVVGVAAAGYGGTVTFADAMPIEVSWPILPGSLSPDNIAITLNTGEVVTPVLAALNPNYDYNERHVIVVFGEFGNRLAPGEAGAVYPVSVAFVEGSSPLMAVGPDGPVSIVGLSAPSANPYVAGPALVGAKLNHFSPVGDFAPQSLANAFPNDAFSHYGDDAEYRLRLYTSGGFSPDGVSGFLPTDFETFFRLHAVDADGNEVLIDEVGRVYDLGVGTVEVVGLAETGAPQDGPYDRAYYVEDHDNYFDIVLRGDEAAVALLRWVEIPTSAVAGYSDIYNPGGPGRTPDPDTIYTKAALPQMFAIDLSLDASRTVSYAAQNFADYDLADDLPVVFRLNDPDGPDRFTTSTNEVAALLGAGLTEAGIDFANEAARPGVLDVEAFFSAATGDRIYTLDAGEIAALSADTGWDDEGRAFGAFDRAWPGAGAVYRFFDPATGWHLFTPDLGEGLQIEGAEYQGIGWYSALFVPVLPSEITFDRSDDVSLTDPIDSDGTLVKEGTGTLEIASIASFEGGIEVEDGKLLVNGVLGGGPLNVGPGGILGGGGIIGTQTNIGGTLSPGQSPGTLTFLAPVVIAPGATLEIEVDGPLPVDGAGGYDRVLVLGAGNGFAADGTLDIRLRGITPPANNDFTPALGQRFDDIVAAAGGVTGSFAALAQPGSGLAPGTRMDVIYGPQTIDLVVTPAAYGDLAAAGVAQNLNQMQVGAALDAIRPAAGIRPTGAAGDLFPALAPLGATAIAPALDSLSGQVHADALDAALAGRRLLQSLVFAPPAGAGRAAAKGAWMQVFDSRGRQRDAGGIAGYDNDHRGFVFGVEGATTPELLLGVSIGQVETRVAAANGSADVTSLFAAVHGVQALGPAVLHGHLVGGTDSYETNRAVRAGAFAADPEGDADGWGVAGAAGLTRAFALAPSFTLAPEAGLAFAHLERKTFSESNGGSAALDVSAASRSSLRSRLGATLAYAGSGVAADVTLGWAHEFADSAAASSAALAGGGFTVHAAPPGRDTLELGTGLALVLGPSTALEAGYRLAASKDATAHAATLNLRVSW